jgi:geranylgeranyl diphosphate synthase, type II
MNIKEEIQYINQELEQYKFGVEPNNLYDPIHYFLNLGGKRFRPLLTFIGAYLYSSEYRKHLLPALATEVFHNFTLVHDDIMDNAPLRRGLETVHQKWNTNIAILSGDVMMVKAYELLLNVEQNKLAGAIQKFNLTAVEVCEGQQYDMDFETRDNVSIEEYIEMIRLKTAVLLGFSLSFGAYLANAPVKDQEALKQFGDLIGIGFQLQDDYLDTFGAQAEVGKTIGGDILQNKKTFLLLKTLELASKEQKATIKKWLLINDQAELKIKTIKDIMLDLGIDQFAKDLMNLYFEKGFACLSNISAQADKVEFLKAFSYQLIEREK